MEFSEVENHDDFYSQDEGRVHVQDQRGYYVIYQAALDDFKWVTFVFVLACDLSYISVKTFTKLPIVFPKPYLVKIPTLKEKHCHDQQGMESEC